MSIQSTRTISRELVIAKITHTQWLVECKDYKELENVTNESDYDIKRFVDKYIPIDLTHVDKWTNSMLEDIINKPFFRYSMFDNYEVEG